MLYLRGISTGAFQEALSAILGADAPNLSPGVMARRTAGWHEDYDRWQGRDLAVRRQVWIWADAVCLRVCLQVCLRVCLRARMEPEAERILVILGATPEGRTALPGFHVGVRESAPSGRELLVDTKIAC